MQEWSSRDAIGPTLAVEK